MAVIYTITTNPSIDYTMDTDLVLGKVNRPRTEVIYPGGKGINVSLALRQLAADDLPQVSEHYKLEGEGYLRFLLERGRLFGGFLDGTMIGFAGFHTEGAMGLLEVFPPYRRRGFASVLEQYL